MPWSTQPREPLCPVCSIRILVSCPECGDGICPECDGKLCSRCDERQWNEDLDDRDIDYGDDE